MLIGIVMYTEIFSFQISFPQNCDPTTCGLGKSSLANSLLGRPQEFKNTVDGKKCFDVGLTGDGGRGKTSDVCPHKNNFLGDPIWPNVSMTK